MPKFKIYEKEGKQIIEHTERPRFTGEITFNNPVSDIENIHELDDCEDVMLWARAMRQAGEFIINFKSETNEID